MMAHVDLCSGIGGFALGFEWAELSKPVLFCDIEPWSRQILAKHWPDVPIAEDVKELANDPTRIIHAIGDRRSILSCGYPCQPFSQAGQRRGSEDDRHIWPEIFSIVQQVRPDWIVCENVSGHITMGLDEVLSDLADKANYAVQTFHLGAVSVDAPHRRMRLWIVARNVADADIINRRAVKKSKQSKGRTWRQSPSNSSSDVANAQSNRTGKSRHAHKTEGSKKSSATQPYGSSADVADAQSKRVQRHGASGQQKPQSYAREKVSLRSSERPRATTWNVEPPVGRVAHGIPRRVDRLKGLGNAIVPQIAMRIGQTIKAVEETT